MDKGFETGEGFYFGLILHARFIKHPNKVQTVDQSIDTVHMYMYCTVYIYNIYLEYISLLPAINPVEQIMYTE